MAPRHSIAAVTALAIGLHAGAARAAGGIRPEDPWNPQHIDGLPSEIRAAVARLCGGSLAAQHAFARYLEKGAVKLVGLHFELLRCGGSARLCTADGCLHQVYISRGGPYRLLRNFYGPELDLTKLRIRPGE
jgi:hypothetical protein